MELCDISVYQ